MKRALGLALAAVMLLPSVAAADVTDLCLRVDLGEGADVSNSSGVTVGIKGGRIDVLAVIPCEGDGASPSPIDQADATYELGGVMSLTASGANYKKGKPCHGKGGYDDIRKGTQVTVRDADGTLLGVGDLSAGEAQSKSKCWFFFIVEDLPETNIYAIEISHRGELIYTFDDLEEREWFITPGLG